MSFYLEIKCIVIDPIRSSFALQPGARTTMTTTRQQKLLLTKTSTFHNEVLLFSDSISSLQYYYVMLHDRFYTICTCSHSKILATIDDVFFESIYSFF